MTAGQVGETLLGAYLVLAGFVSLVKTNYAQPWRLIALGVLFGGLMFLVGLLLLVTVGQEVSGGGR